MNANELADKIEDARNETDFQRWANEAPDVLRQQQELFEMALKALTVAHNFCGSLTSDVCPDTVAIPINKALANLIKAQEKC